MIWWINGAFVDSKKATLPIADISILRGVGVFDFLITYDSVPFHLDKHIDRLYTSARLIGIAIQYPKEDLMQAAILAVKKNKLASVAIRIIVSGGVSSNNLFADGPNTVAILIEKRTLYPASVYAKGIKLEAREYMRYIPGAKHTNYLPAAVEKQAAAKRGALEILYVYNGHVYECTTSNIFIVRDDTLITPENDILKGVTREVVLTLARKHMKVRTRAIKTGELFEAAEVFITASDKELMPVVSIDGKKIGIGKPGDYTKQLMKSFREYTDQYLKN